MTERIAELEKENAELEKEVESLQYRVERLEDRLEPFEREVRAEMRAWRNAAAAYLEELKAQPESEKRTRLMALIHAALSVEIE